MTRDKSNMQVLCIVKAHPRIIRSDDAWVAANRFGNTMSGTKGGGSLLRTVSLCIQCGTIRCKRKIQSKRAFHAFLVYISSFHYEMEHIFMGVTFVKKEKKRKEDKRKKRFMVWQESEVQTVFRHWPSKKKMRLGGYKPSKREFWTLWLRINWIAPYIQRLQCIHHGWSTFSLTVRVVWQLHSHRGVSYLQMHNCEIYLPKRYRSNPNIMLRSCKFPQI